MLEVVYIFLGLLGLWLGSDVAVDAARSIAKKVGVSDLVIGLTVTSIGTSLPEILTNVIAGFNTKAGVDASGIAVGNIIGSDLAQITLLLGLAGFVATLTIPMKSLKRDGVMLIAAVVLMYMMSLDGYVSQLEGLFLVLSYIMYLSYIFYHEKKTSPKRVRKRDYRIMGDLVKSVIGLVVVVVAADLVVSRGVSLAYRQGITPSIIGLFVGLGTSIPELSVSLKAISKKAGKLSLGNLIGSNITDPMLSFGLGAMIAGVSISEVVLKFDFVYWMGATSIALLLLYNHMNLNRKEASVLIVTYLLFMYTRITFFMT